MSVDSGEHHVLPKSLVPISNQIKSGLSDDGNSPFCILHNRLGDCDNKNIQHRIEKTRILLIDPEKDNEIRFVTTTL